LPEGGYGGNSRFCLTSRFWHPICLNIGRGYPHKKACGHGHVYQISTCFQGAPAPSRIASTPYPGFPWRPSPLTDTIAPLATRLPFNERHLRSLTEINAVWGLDDDAHGRDKKGARRLAPGGESGAVPTAMGDRDHSAGTAYRQPASTCGAKSPQLSRQTPVRSTKEASQVLRAERLEPHGTSPHGNLNLRVRLSIRAISLIDRLSGRS
jgi:hypothetical protein